MDVATRSAGSFTLELNKVLLDPSPFDRKTVANLYWFYCRGRKRCKRQRLYGHGEYAGELSENQQFSTYQQSAIINLCIAHFPLFLHAQNKG